MTRRPSPAGPILILALLGAGASFVGVSAPASREARQPVNGIPVSQTAIPGASTVPAEAGGREGATGTAADVLLGAPERAAPSSAVASSRVVARATARPRSTVSPGATIRPVPATKPLRRPQPVKTATGPTLRGIASYYGTGGPGMYAAMHEYRDGTRVIVQVCAPYNGRVPCITVPVVTQCAACRWAAGATLVDLSVPAWLEIAGGRPLSRGVLAVTVTILEGSVG